MSEILHIKNFGPIKDVKLELKKFNVIIGENATGKSTVAKVLSMCRYFSYLIRNSYAVQPFEEGLTSRGLGEFIKQGSYIFYECKDYIFKIERIVETVPNRDQDGSYYEYDIEMFSSNLTPKSNEFKNLLGELESIKPKEFSLYDISLLDWNIPTSFFLNDVSRVMDNPFYLPTERGLQSIFSLGKNSIPNISDFLYNYFAKMERIESQLKNDINITPLNIAYRNEKGTSKFRKLSDDNFHNLKNAASGYKSAIPIILVIEYYNEIRKKQKTFIIEEPELNLFPEIQQKLMKFLVDKTLNYDNTTLLTTHSPYVLTSLNNLMYAYEIGKLNPSEVDKIIQKKYWLNPKDVSVYMLNELGNIEDILDRTENLIHAEKIDSVSTIINKEFDSLIDLEITNADEKNQ